MARDIVHYFKNLIEETGLDKKEHNFSAEEFCEKLGMSVDSVMNALLILFLMENKKALNLKAQNGHVVLRNDLLEKSLAESYKGNGRLKQIALVQSGLPIANKKSKCLADLKLRIRLGENDQELMKEYGISRTTLWRWKKEIEEEDKRIKEIVKKNSKYW